MRRNREKNPVSDQNCVLDEMSRVEWVMKGAQFPAQHFLRQREVVLAHEVDVVAHQRREALHIFVAHISKPLLCK